jgi:iron complex outermembrane receptor protein
MEGLPGPYAIAARSRVDDGDQLLQSEESKMGEVSKIAVRKLDRWRSGLRWFLGGVFLLCCSTPIFGQQLSLAGTVRDADGAVPDATVVLSSGDNRLSTVMTDGSGRYRFSNLAVGSYELSVSKQGFETVVRNVSLGPNTPPVDVALTVGRVSTTVTVTAAEGRATATRLPVPDLDVPVQVSTIPQELMLQQGSNSVMDALKNASGVESFRWYGVYEQYSIRGFADPDRDDYNVLLVDGMRFAGNRYSTQTNNVESIQVLKGPSSILYGRGAVGGAINIIRKKPQPSPAYDFTYRGGRFNSHQVAGGATGPIDSRNHVLYRLDASFDHSNGWRHAGTDRVNVSPSLTWNIAESARLTIREVFNRDRFDGDGGVPLNITTLPSYRPDLRFSLPQDRVLVQDSQTQALFNVNLSSNWELRENFMVQRTSDRYFVTEGVYGDPANNLVYREPLDFHHTRTPIQNQAELVGSLNLNGLGRHNLLFGYEYFDDDYRTDVTAGDDPDCTCGYWWLTIEPIDITTLVENNPPLDISTIARQTFVTDRIHSLYWQDQIDILPQLKLNVGGRFDDYSQRVDRLYLLDPFDMFPDGRYRLRTLDQSAYTYRAGFVYAPRYDHQLYFGTASSYTPVRDVPANGAPLDPSTARNYEVGYRWQGWDGRVNTSVAFYYTMRNNIGVAQNATTVLQVGEQRSKGIDLDVNTDVGGRTHLIFNYGYNHSRYADADDVGLTGLQPRFAPNHTANAWLRKDWRWGVNTSLGARYVGHQFVTDDNSTTLGGYTVLSGAVGLHRDQWEWSLNAENLFNRERYFLPGHYSNLVFPGPPINVFTTIRLRFR